MSLVPRVAIVMPAHDAARTIAASLASACAQTLVDSAIIVVDDGSTDATAAIVTAAALRDPRIRLIRQAKSGPMVARNRAIAATTAPWIAPLDADDLWHPDYLATLVAALEANPAAGFAYALHHVIDARDRIVATSTALVVQGDAVERHLLVNFVGCGSAALFRREALIAAGGYDPATRAWGGAEDYLLQLRIATLCPIVCVPRRLVGYRRVAGSLSDDPLRMAQARCRAVATSLHEQRRWAPAIRRWVAADGDRTAAALLIRRGQWWQAIRPAVRALVLDPVATLLDLVRRIGNRHRRSRAVRACVAFADARPEDEKTGPHDWLTTRRLRRLAARDASPQSRRSRRPI